MSDSSNKHAAFSFLESLVLILLGAGIVILWYNTPSIVGFFSGLPNDKLADRGQYGDAFGITNALFSGLAFLGVVAALFFQRKDLMAQVKEFEGQNELTKQQLAFQEIQARVAALPIITFSASVSGKISNPERWNVTVTNQGEVALDFKVFHIHANQPVFESKAFGRDSKGFHLPSNHDNALSIRITFITKLAEEADYQFYIGNAESVEVNPLHEEVKKIREDVQRKFPKSA